LYVTLKVNLTNKGELEGLLDEDGYRDLVSKL